MYASRSRCDSPAWSTLATAFDPSESSASYTSPMQPPPIGRARTSLVPSAASTPPEIRRSTTIRGVLLLDLLLHRQDVVEVVAILRRYPSRPLGAKVQTPRSRAPLRPLIRRVSDVPGAGPGRVHEDLILQPFAPQHVLEDALSQRRAADVSQADEEHAYHKRVL